MATNTQSLVDLERRLTLTSPPIQGERVRELQLMLRHNPFGTFEPGRDDGVYDELTASATRRAWYWMGCPDEQIGEHTDGTLFDLLAGVKELPSAWSETRAGRLRRAEETMLWDAALTVAREQLGKREDGVGSKRTPYTLWYGVLCPYSVVFAAFCYAQAGSTAFQPGSRYAYAPYMLDDARRGLNFLSLALEPLRGDLALIDGDGDGIPDRVAFFDGFELEHEPETFDAIEGDVGREGDVTGAGAVARTRREQSQVIAFVHVRA
jgi:hypothetical protein